MKSIILLISTIVSSTVCAQESRTLAQNLPPSNEIGVRYGVQIGPGSTDMQYVGVDYARYNFYNIGFRTGLNWFTTNIGPGQYASIPMQFTWRSGRLVNKNPDADIYGYYYNGQHYPGNSQRSPVSNIVFSRLPSIVELHAGVTPGLLFGSRVASDYPAYEVARRFTCSADVGIRINLPIKRFRIFLDATYHCYLTRNFRNQLSDSYLGRSFADIGGGMAYNF